jgi:hypothetical protein
LTVIKPRKDRSRAFPKRIGVGTYRSHPRAFARVAFSGSLRTGPAPQALAKSVSAFRQGAQRFIAGWSSPVARQAHNLKVTGSNPVPATKIDTKNPAISMDCGVFVFKVEPSPQQNQWLSFVGSNHPQPIAECISAAGEPRFASARRALRSAWPYASNPIILVVEHLRQAAAGQPGRDSSRINAWVRSWPTSPSSRSNSTCPAWPRRRGGADERPNRRKKCPGTLGCPAPGPVTSFPSLPPAELQKLALTSQISHGMMFVI